MIRRVLFSVAAVIIGASLQNPSLAQGAPSSELTVCETCEVSDLQTALDTVPAGGTITLQSGIYEGHFVTSKPVVIQGVDDPVIDGGSSGTVLQLQGDYSTVEGVTISGTGINHDHEDAAILVTGSGTTIRNVTIEDALFGVLVKAASSTTVENNSIGGKDELSMGIKGDAVKIWNSPGAVVRGNRMDNIRDLLLWYSDDCILEDNHVTNSRYGLHLMWSNNCVIQNNYSSGNSVGAYAMYSQNLQILGNMLVSNRSGTGMGVGFRDSDNAVLQNNKVFHNRIGVAVFNSPRGVNAENHFTDNVLAHNDVGMTFDTSGRGVVITGNDFIDNLTQISTESISGVDAAEWNRDGSGNYWSDYTGYDTDGDGVGDVEYAPIKTFETLVNANPDFALFYQSPAAQALDWAAAVFPVLSSRSVLTDIAPLTEPAVPVADSAASSVNWALIGGSAAALVAGLALVLGIGRFDGRHNRLEADA